MQQSRAISHKFTAICHSSNMSEEAPSPSKPQVRLQTDPGVSKNVIAFHKKNIQIHTEGSEDPEDPVDANTRDSATNPTTLNNADKLGRYEFLLTVGRVEDGSVVLLTEDHHIINMPLCLLPADVHPGHVLKLAVCRDLDAENERRRYITQLQGAVLANRA